MPSGSDAGTSDLVDGRVDSTGHMEVGNSGREVRVAMPQAKVVKPKRT